MLCALFLVLFRVVLLALRVRWLVLRGPSACIVVTVGLWLRCERKEPGSVGDVSLDGAAEVQAEAFAHTAEVV